MKRLAVLTLLLFTSTSWSDARTATSAAVEALDPIAQPISESIDQFATELTARSKLFGGEARRKLAEQKAAPQGLGNTAVIRSTRECMKPGNVIDEEVRNCTKGLQEKTW